MVKNMRRVSRGYQASIQRWKQYFLPKRGLKNEAELFYLHQYDSYEEYKRVQEFHNRRKIDRIWADAVTLERVARIVLERFETPPLLGLCHGTRNGFEQKYLNQLGVGIRAIGTDISETAKSFPNSLQWDFHDPNPSWVGRFDFIYTNSLDQSWQPKQALEVWLEQVKEKGVVIVEHTDSHGPRGASEMDPFGVVPEVFPYVLTMWFGDQISISHSVGKKQNMEMDAHLFVISKNSTHRSPETQ